MDLGNGGGKDMRSNAVIYIKKNTYPIYKEDIQNFFSIIGFEYKDVLQKKQYLNPFWERFAGCSEVFKEDTLEEALKHAEYIKSRTNWVSRSDALCRQSLVFDNDSPNAPKSSENVYPYTDGEEEIPSFILEVITLNGGGIDIQLKKLQGSDARLLSGFELLIEGHRFHVIRDSEFIYYFDWHTHRGTLSDIYPCGESELLHYFMARADIVLVIKTKTVYKDRYGNGKLIRAILLHEFDIFIPLNLTRGNNL